MGAIIHYSDESDSSSTIPQEGVTRYIFSQSFKILMSTETSRMGVASVLINLYDKYLSDKRGKLILQALMLLIDDIGLTEDLCILVVERIRLQVMVCNSDRKTMSYESFYDWLRQISDLVFMKCDEKGPRALNLLLTKHIIPFAISGQRFKIVSSRQHIVIDDGAMRVFMPYAEFLHLWNTPKIITENIRLSPLHCFPLRSVYQPQTDSSSRTVSMERIFEGLKSSGIFPIDVMQDTGAFFSEMVEMAASPHDAVGSGDALNCLAFPRFLSVLEKLAGRMDMTCAILMGVELPLTGRLIVMIQKLTETLLKLSLQKFADQERRVNAEMKTFKNASNYSCTLRDNPVRDNCRTHTLHNPVAQMSSFLDILSVLWLARQAGITQLPGLSLDCLVEELLSRADVTQGQKEKGYTLGGFRSLSASSSTSLRELKWSVSRLPRVLCEIVESYSSGAEPEVFNGGLVEVSSTGRLSLLLAQHLPAVFFASSERSPAMVASLYEPQKLQQLHLIAVDMDTFFEALFPPPFEHKDSFCTLAATTAATLRQNANCNRVGRASFRDFNRLCSSSGATPHLLSVSVVQETCEHVLGFLLSEEAMDVKICKNDWIEVLYVLAQVCLNDDGEVSAEDDSIQKLFELAKCFSSRSYLSQAIGRYRKGSVPHLLLRQTLQPQNQSFPFPFTAPISSLTKSHIAGCSSSQLDVLRHKGKRCSLVYRIEDRLRDSSSDRSASHRNNLISSDSNRCAFISDLPNSVERNVSSGLSLRQIAIALVHYPRNNMDLNPWNIHNMIVAAQGGCNVAIAADTRQCLGRFIKAFCAQFRVPSTDITEYLFSLHKEDYYIADAAQMLQVRNAEKQHGVSGGQFLFDGHGKYTRKINVMKPAVVGVMAAGVFDLLFTDRIANLLDTHSHLLSWEYSRAFSKDRTQDPFTRHLKCPLPTARSFHDYPEDCRMSSSSAIRWAEDMAGITNREATIQLKRTALLSGGGCVSTEYHLTYSVFLIFAVHCFSSQALLALPSYSSSAGQEYQSIDILEACIAEMLERSAAMLSSAKCAIRIDVSLLDFMFPRYPQNADSSFPRLSASERLIVVRHSVSAFNLLLPETACQSLPSPPPSYMWDAARFLQYCRYYGLIERTGTLAAPLNAFIKLLKAEGPLSTASGTDFIIAPTQVRCSSSVVLSLLDDMARGAFEGTHNHCDLVLELLPIMISFLNLELYGQQTLSHHNDLSSGADSSEKIQQKSQLHVSAAWFSFEDILRYGGARSMSAFFLYRDQLHHLYSLMVRASHYVLLNEPLPARGIFKLPMCGDVLLGADDIEEAHGSSGEALLSVVCSYLSCSGLLQTDKIAAIAKGSLHPRLRPLHTSAARRQQHACRATDALYAAAEDDSSSGDAINEVSPYPTSSSQDLVTVSLAEFEVMLLQCAFACWEASGAFTITNDICSEGGAHSEPDPATLLEACRRGTADWDSEDLSVVREAAYLYCIEGMQTPDMDADTSSRAFSENSWGLDFLGPFVRTLFALSGVPHQHSLAVHDPQALVNARAIAVFRKDAVEVNRKAMESNLFHAERDRSLASEQKLLRHGEVDRKYVDSSMSGRIPNSVGRSAVKREVVSDMQRLMNRTEHLGSAAVGIHLLIGGTNVELWPLFASYRDGPSSCTPGMLTGPRLFALLSRLNLLTTTTSLSHIGLLLHQISAHLHAKARVPHGSLLPPETSISTALSYEQFIVFLCAFSELFYKDANFDFETEGGDTESTDSSVTSVSSTITKNTPVRVQLREAHLSPVCTTPRESGDSTSSDAGQSWPLYRPKDVSISSGNIRRVDGRHSPRQRRTAEPPGLNVIICSTAEGTGGKESPTYRWFMQWKEPMESSKTFRMLLINELLPALLRGSSTVSSDGVQQGFGSRNSDPELDRFSVLFSLDVLLVLQGFEFFLRSVSKSDPYINRETPSLPQTSCCTESKFGRGSRDICNLQPSSCPSSSSSSTSSPSPSTPTSSSSTPTSCSMASLLRALVRIGIVPLKITEARFFQLVEEILHLSNNGQYSSQTMFADHLHEGKFLRKRCHSQNYLMKDSGFMRESLAATAEGQARARVDWHPDPSGDLAHMQWLIGAVALDTVLDASHPSPLTCNQSHAHPDIETVSDLVVEQLRWMAASFTEKHVSISSRTSRKNAAGIPY